jgi:formate hydrogenlyase subunit 3/multisubunit Na+/H+ antiporter MnhD subunit
MAAKMKESRLRAIVTTLIMFSTTIIFLMTAILYFLHGYDQEELKDLLAILAPVFSVYLTAVVKYSIENKSTKPKTDRLVNAAYIRVTFWFLPLHFVIIMTTLLLKSLYNVISFSELKVCFSAIEIFFGVYVAYIITSLFPTEK